MGDLRPDNGGGTPPEDGSGEHGDRPEFPPEWGTIVIPDDASELDHEAAALRRELRRHHRRSRPGTAFGLSRSDSSSLGVPVVIIVVAVITTLLSLFVVTWNPRPTPVTPTEGGTSAPPAALVNITLADAGGNAVRLGGLLPAVLLLADGCDCSALIIALATAAPAPVTIVPIGRLAPCPVGTAPNVRCLTDPQGAVTSRYPVASTTQPASPSGSISLAPTTTVGAATVGAGTVKAATARTVLIDSNGTVTGPVTISRAVELADAVRALVGG